jgi:hypothetical protein
MSIESVPGFQQKLAQVKAATTADGRIDLTKLRRDYEHGHVNHGARFYQTGLSVSDDGQARFNQLYLGGDWHPDWPALKMNGEVVAL